MRLTTLLNHRDLDFFPCLEMSVGDVVRLSFAINSANGPGDQLPPDAPERITQIQGSEYTIDARVINSAVRPDLFEDWQDLILEAQGFRFQSAGVFKGSIGDRIRLRGFLLVGGQMWEDNLNGFENPADIFYDLRVAGIRQERRSNQRFGPRRGEAALYPNGFPAYRTHENDLLEVSKVAEFEEILR